MRKSSAESFLNLSPLYTVVSKNVDSVPERSYYLSTDLPYWKNVIYESFPNERFCVASAKGICFYFCREDVGKSNNILEPIAVPWVCR